MIEHGTEVVEESRKSGQSSEKQHDPVSEGYNTIYHSNLKQMEIGLESHGTSS